MYFPPFGGIDLKYGDKNESVETLKAAMNVIFENYPMCSLLTLSWDFDDDMEKAVRKIQQTVGLNENGVVDVYTWSAVFALYNLISIS